jgi:hypothetical protein
LTPLVARRYNETLMSRLRWIALSTGVALVILGCPTTPEVPEEEPVVETVVEVVDEPETATAETEQVAGEESTEAEPNPETEQEAEPEPIEVPEDVYNQAFKEVEAVIAELNQIIYRGDFDAWMEHLTDHYRDIYSDPEVLAEISQQPVLAQSNIQLRTIHDYFRHVFVPSRARARLDDLVFYSDTVVEAVTIFRGEPLILYLLRKVDGEWRIDTF